MNAIAKAQAVPLLSVPPEMVDHALALAALGFPVFPCWPGTKLPAFPAVKDRSLWQEFATTDALTLAEKWCENPSFNPAVFTRGLVVIDVDTHKGIALEVFTSLGAVPKTFTVRTARGGYHFYFKTDERFGNSSGALPKGIDVRGHGGLVLGPGAEFEGKRYEIIDDTPPAPLPQWLASLLRRVEKTTSEPGSMLGDVDDAASIERAKAYIAKQAPAVQGDGGDGHTYKNCCKLRRDLNLSVDTSLELLEDWNAGCSPPWDEDDLATKLGNAGKYGQNLPGSDTPSVGLQTIGHPAKNSIGSGEADEPPLPFESSAERWLGKEPAPIRFLVDKLVPMGYVTVLAAAGGRGKSMLCLQLMACVAARKDFLGYPVLEDGSAAGIFSEDDDNVLHGRTKTICKNLGIDFSAIASKIDPVSYVTSADVLWQNDRPTPALEKLRAAVLSKPALKLLILDGSSDLLILNEIDRGQVTRAMRCLTKLAQDADIAIVLLCHESKSNEDNDTHATSGTTAWINKSRALLKIGEENERGVCEVKHVKANLGPKQSAITCTRRDGVFIATAGDRYRAQACLKIADELIRAAIVGGQNLSTSINAGNYAPKFLTKHPRGGEFAVTEYETAIRSLLETTLAVETYGSKDSQRYVLKNADGPADGTVVPVPNRYKAEPSTPKKTRKSRQLSGRTVHSAGRLPDQPSSQ